MSKQGVLSGSPANMVDWMTGGPAWEDNNMVDRRAGLGGVNKMVDRGRGGGGWEETRG